MKGRRRVLGAVRRREGRRGRGRERAPAPSHPSHRSPVDAAPPHGNQAGTGPGRLCLPVRFRRALDREPADQALVKLSRVRRPVPSREQGTPRWPARRTRRMPAAKAREAPPTARPAPWRGCGPRTSPRWQMRGTSGRTARNPPRAS